jgi:hypothetical protein
LHQSCFILFYANTITRPLQGSLFRKFPGGRQAPPIKNQNGNSPIFSNSLQHLVQGFARASKGNLMHTSDLGVPNSEHQKCGCASNNTTESALPSDTNAAEEARHQDPTKPFPLLSVTAATENCNTTMNDILIDSASHCGNTFVSKYSRKVLRLGLYSVNRNPDRFQSRIHE